jgi:hypothetical protein
MASDSLKWRLNQWDEKQRQEWRAAMKRSHEVFLERVPNMREVISGYEERIKNKKK